MGQAACPPPPSSDKAGLPVMAHPWSVLPQDSEGTGQLPRSAGDCQHMQVCVRQEGQRADVSHKPCVAGRHLEITLKCLTAFGSHVLPVSPKCRGLWERCHKGNSKHLALERKSLDTFS